LEFVSQPAPYYYALPIEALVVPCHAQEVLVDDTRQTVSTTMFVNSFTISISRNDAPGDRYHIIVDDEGNMIGLLILRTGESPAPSVLRCSVVVNGVEVRTTGDSPVVIGGEPEPSAV
jgi:hypothetical protein